MRISLSKVLLVAIIITLSITIGHISKIITVNLDVLNAASLKHRNSENYSASDYGFTITDSAEHLLWFLQISDIHISIFFDMKRVSDLREFCDITVSTIKPSVVLASGDLTDAKQPDSLGSQQFEDEWRNYKNTLDECKVSEKTAWLDVRGNHDNFNVPGPKSKENYFRNYSMQGAVNPKSYLYQVRGDSGELYSFIALDACLDPGPRRPFNFVGVLTHQETNNVRNLIQQAESSGSNYTIWFGHYPTSCILAPGEGVRSIIGSHEEGLAYLCGHLHTLGGVVPNMYTLQQAGFLELELADWKSCRMYRLFAIDHGLLSFVDIEHRKWPVALITNPKHALFIVPGKEPLHRMATSTHIRVLAFSTSKIVKVRVKLNEDVWKTCQHVKGPLYVIQWDPAYYQFGIHHISVYVIDAAGREYRSTQPFSLDGTKLSFSVLPRLVLMTNISTTFQILFGAAMICSVVPLCCLRMLNIRHKVQRASVPKTSVTFVKWWFRKLWIVANIDRFFIPLVLYPLYLAFGPWSVGEIIEGHIGVIFAWGLFVRGTYLPGSFTYAYGYFQLITFEIPLILVLAHHLDKRLHKVHHTTPCSKTEKILCKIWKEFPFIVLLSMQVIFAFSFWLSYGTLALILGPLRTWPLVMGFYLWRQVHTLPQHVIRDAVSALYEAT